MVEGFSGVFARPGLQGSDSFAAGRLWRKVPGCGGKKGHTRTHLNQITTAVRENTPKGHTLWTDISHKHPSDFAGNQYSRTFAEQVTGGCGCPLLDGRIRSLFSWI